MNNFEYWKEIRSLAGDIVGEAMEAAENDREEAEEIINDSLLHETIDGHQWVIYYSYNLDVLKHSDNADYMIDQIGGESEILKEQGLTGLHMCLAFWAMYADVQNQISTILDEYDTEVA